MVMSRVRGSKDQTGATTAEYAVCRGAGVGFAGILFKLVTSDVGQNLVKNIFEKIVDILPF